MFLLCCVVLLCADTFELIPVAVLNVRQTTSTSFQNIHGPYTCDPQYRALYADKGFTEGEQTMFGYMSEMDAAVGEIMKAFKASGKYSNSYIFYSSDK